MWDLALARVNPDSLHWECESLSHWTTREVLSLAMEWKKHKVIAVGELVTTAFTEAPSGGVRYP